MVQNFRKFRGKKNLNSSSAPFGWNTWSSTPGAVFAIKPGEGRNNSVAASISNARLNAVILQAVDVDPGDSVLCTGWVKGIGSGEISFGFRLQERSGRWHSRQDLESSSTLPAGAITEWQPMSFQIKAPEDCGKVVIMLGARLQTDEGQILFDDIELIKYAKEK